MTLREIAAIAMDEALCEEEESYLSVVEDKGGKGANFQRTMARVNNAMSAPKAAPGAKAPKVGTTSAPTGAQGLNAQKPDAGGADADHASKYPGSFGKPECFSKNKDGCRNHKTGIFAEKGSPFAKLDASGNQVFATQEQMAAKGGDGEEAEAKKVEGDKADAATASTEEKANPETAKKITETLGDDAAKAAANLKPAEQEAVGKLGDLAANGAAPQAIEAAEKVLSNPAATDADKKVASEMKAKAEKEYRTGLVGLFKQETDYAPTYEQYQKDFAGLVDGDVFCAADYEGEDHWYVKKDGKVYAADADGNAVGEEMSADEVLGDMLVKNDMWQTAEANKNAATAQAESQQPAPSPSLAPAEAPEPSPAPAEKSSGETAQTQPAAEQSAAQQAPAQPEEAKEDFSIESMNRVLESFNTPEKLTERANKVQQDAFRKAKEAFDKDGDEGKYLKALQKIKADHEKAIAEIKQSAPKEEQKPADKPAKPEQKTEAATEAEAPAEKKPAPAEATQPAPKAETAPAQPAQQPAEPAEQKTEPKAQETSEKPEQPAQEPAAQETSTQEPQSQEQSSQQTEEPDDLKDDSVAYLNEVQAGEPITMKDADGNPDSGANKMVKATDGKFYRVDAEGKPTGQGYTAEQAYAEMKNNLDPVPKGQSIEEHIEHCKANPPSNCPFLRQHIGEMTAEQQHQVFGGEPPQSDGQPVTAPSLAKLVSDGVVDDGTARAVETGLTAENTGLDGEELDALRESAAQALADKGAESIRRTLADLATVAAAKRIDVNDPEAREQAVSESLLNAFTPTTEEGKKLAEEKIARAERWGIKMTEAEKKHLRRAAEIEVRGEAQRKAMEALQSATEEMAKLGPGLGRMLEGLADRKLTDIQNDNIEAMKKIIGEAKNDKAALSARNKLEKYLAEQGLDKPMESDPSWEAVSTPEDFGQGSDEGNSSPAKQAYEADLAELQKKMDEDDDFTAEDYDKGVAAAAAKARAAGYDPSVRAGGDLYASGISDKTFNKAFGGESKLLQDAKKAKPTEDELNQEAADSASLIEELFRKKDRTTIDRKTNQSITTKFGVEVAGTSRNGNDIVVKVKFAEGADPKILTAMRDRLALALGKPDLQIKKVSGKNEAEITYSHKGQDFHMMSDELKDSDTRKKVAESGVPLILGRAGDKNIVEDMRSGTNPHLLITGGTNSGKSRVGMNILAGWMMKDPRVCTPFVIDPKGEFEGACNGTAGIGYSGKGGNVQAALRFLNEEMNRRLSVLKDYKNIDEYNKRHPNNPMPMMPILFDEISKSLNEDTSGQSEALFNNLAKLCRSAGMNIVGLTQGARDIKQDTLKNLGRRFALKAANNTESAATLGAGRHEATRSKGNGDGFYSADGSDPVRIQAPLLNDDDPDSGRDDLMRLKKMRNAKGHRKAVSKKEIKEKARSRFSVSR